METKREYKLRKYWEEELTLINKVNLLAKNHFWDGLATYKYEYIPEDLKNVLWLKMHENASK